METTVDDGAFGEINPKRCEAFEKYQDEHPEQQFFDQIAEFRRIEAAEHADDDLPPFDLE